MHPMILLGDEAQVDARFSPFGHSANVGAEIVLDEPDGTPR